ncbi:RING-type domain-containing protein [Fusarium keratoplasticum]|uniref:RING-type domain-containing protein n=1 Tax=Fusarium keratoplasticum TaxID=1328300 RepID=A0ACC0QVC8_9HYPO|nr:RING-type domain-containing protein [Fusarium keratoplasticum]KAI8668934.1 RING-type domain-containing protein [Fusarium keratoplasticum]
MEADQSSDDLERQVLQSTLAEIATTQEDAVECCVICLEGITEACEVVPCQHRNFDYLCLLSWLEQTPKCPLCKATISQVRHALDEPVPKTYVVPKSSPKPQNQRSDARPYSLYSVRRNLPRRRRYSRSRYETPPNPSDEIARRRDVYRYNRYSKHVGSNRLSRYRELTPAVFCADAELVSRARMWIRRELQVFSFLAPDNEEPQPGDGNARTAVDRRRANNAEFLLEYIIAVLKSVDIMGSAGQAENMISEFLGRDSTRLFLHELRAWLRSPFTKLADWDRAVQYDEVSAMSSRGSRPEPDGEAVRQRHRQANAEHDKNSGATRRHGDFYRPRGGRSQRSSSYRHEPYDRRRSGVERRA